MQTTEITLTVTFSVYSKEPEGIKKAEGMIVDALSELRSKFTRGPCPGDFLLGEGDTEEYREAYRKQPDLSIYYGCTLEGTEIIDHSDSEYRRQLIQNIKEHIRETEKQIALLQKETDLSDLHDMFLSGKDIVLTERQFQILNNLDDLSDELKEKLKRCIRSESDEIKCT
jgi:hypothetical protein